MSTIFQQISMFFQKSIDKHTFRTVKYNPSYEERQLNIDVRLRTWQKPPNAYGMLKGNTVTYHSMLFGTVSE